MRRGDNIRQRADGRFEARYAKGRDGRGRIVYGCCYGRTYEEAAQKRAEALRRMVTVREMNLLILGAGSHGQEVWELAGSLRVFRKIAFLDDVKPEAVGPCRDFARYVDTYPAAVVAVGDASLRMRWLGELAAAGFVLPALIHPSATVSASARVGYGSVICARAAVSAGAVIGCGCILSSGSAIDRNAVIADGTHILCGQTVAAGEKIDQEGVRLYG